MAKVEKKTPDWFDDKKFIQAFAQTYPHLLDVQQLIKELGFGRLNIIFTVNNGEVLHMEIIGQELIRYDLNESLSKRRSK